MQGHKRGLAITFLVWRKMHNNYHMQRQNVAWLTCVALNAGVWPDQRQRKEAGLAEAGEAKAGRVKLKELWKQGFIEVAGSWARACSYLANNSSGLP